MGPDRLVIVDNRGNTIFAMIQLLQHTSSTCFQAVRSLLQAAAELRKHHENNKKGGTLAAAVINSICLHYLLESP